MGQQFQKAQAVTALIEPVQKDNCVLLSGDLPQIFVDIAAEFLPGGRRLKPTFREDPGYEGVQV